MKPINSDIKLFIDSAPITQINETKFLGVIINESLNWSSHMHAVKLKVMKSLGVIRRIKQNVPLCVVVSAYFNCITTGTNVPVVLGFVPVV